MLNPNAGMTVEVAGSQPHLAQHRDAAKAAHLQDLPASVAAVPSVSGTNNVTR
jgi:hypothetical protein